MTEQHCKPCEGGTPPLDKKVISEQLKTLHPEWQVAADQKKIHRTFLFKNFYHTMGFVNAIAWMANQENHHPDLEVSYDRCIVHYHTHAIGGLSNNDFICATKVDLLYKTNE